jgi:hypothetical protein
MWKGIRDEYPAGGQTSSVLPDKLELNQSVNAKLSGFLTCPPECFLLTDIS